MKSLWISLAWVVVVVASLGIGCAKPRFDARVEESAIRSMLDDWHNAAAVADESRYFGHFAPSAVFLGTDATERWSTSEFRAYAHPFFARGHAWSMHSVQRHVHVQDEHIAWFDEQLATARLGPARGSGVVHRDSSGTWRIEQYNLALTVPNERFAEVRALLAAPPAAAPANAR